MGTHTIDFITVGGAQTGMGHFMRCATLAREAANRGWGVRAFIEGEPDILERWRQLTGLEHVDRWAHWAALGTKSTKGHLRTKSGKNLGMNKGRGRGAPPVVALDYPERKSAWLERVRENQLRSLVIDDPEYSDLSNWTLLPALHHGSVAHEPTTDLNERVSNTVFAGPRYTILSPAHRSQIAVPRQARRRLLLSMGGADPHNLTEQLAPVISKALEPLSREMPSLVREVVLGPAYPDPDLRVANHLSACGWKVHKAISEAEMAHLMSGTRLAIIGFGTSTSELAYHRTPFLTVTHHPHDRAPARDLEAMGIGRVLGTAGDLDLESVLRRVRRSLTDRLWQDESALQAYTLIEGWLGARRVFEAIEARLGSSTESSDSDSESKDDSKPSNHRRALPTPFRVA